MTPSHPKPTKCPYGQAFTIFCEMLAQETDECILWPYGKRNDGSAVIRLGGSRYQGRTELAHRLAWVMTYREQIELIHIKQRCGNLNCFNPRHLEKDPQTCKMRQGLAVLLKLSNTDTDECVLWPYSQMMEGRGLNRKPGRGMATIDGQKMSTNRAAWLVNGRPLDENQVVRHSCDNPQCVNLRHLLAGTQRENIEDCIRRGRKVVRCGELNARSILTESQVKEIRFLYCPGSPEWGARPLARRYGVARSTVTQLLEGVTWKHLL